MFNPSVEGALLGDADRQQFNADVLFDPARTPIAPYAGAGVCVVSGPQSETSAGLNLVGGANLDLGAADAFVELRLTLADGVHLSLTAGAFPRLD